MDANDVKEWAGKFSPPFGVCAVLSIPIILEASGVWYDWPILGEFQLTNSLKSLLIAMVWFLVFVGFALWKKFNPNYSDFVRENTIKARKILANNLDGDFDFEHDTMAIELPVICSNLQSISVGELLVDCLAGRGSSKDFWKKTNWVKQK